MAGAFALWKLQFQGERQGILELLHTYCTPSSVKHPGKEMWDKEKKGEKNKAQMPITRKEDSVVLWMEKDVLGAKQMQKWKMKQGLSHAL